MSRGHEDPRYYSDPRYYADPRAHPHPHPSVYSPYSHPRGEYGAPPSHHHHAEPRDSFAAELRGYQERRSSSTASTYAEHRAAKTYAEHRSSTGSTYGENRSASSYAEHRANRERENGDRSDRDRGGSRGGDSRYGRDDRGGYRGPYGGGGHQRSDRVQERRVHDPNSRRTSSSSSSFPALREWPTENPEAPEDTKMDIPRDPRKRVFIDMSKVDQVLDTLPKGLSTKQGTTGQKITVRTNAFRIRTAPNWTIFQYHVDFTPPVDDPRFRRILVNREKETLKGHCCDGQLLFTVARQRKLEFPQTLPNETEDQVVMTLKETGVVSGNDRRRDQIYNIVQKRSNFEKMARFGRNLYNPQAEFTNCFSSWIS